MVSSGRLKNPTTLLIRSADHQQLLDDLSQDLVDCFHKRLNEFKSRLAQESGRLSALSPLAVLDRGYSIVHQIPGETIVKDAAVLQDGDRLRVTFAKGKAICRVEEKL